MLHIIQINVQHKILMASGRVSEIYSIPRQKIHLVDAESGEKAIEKLTDYYKEKKPTWRIIVIDTEELIS